MHPEAMSPLPEVPLAGAPGKAFFRREGTVYLPLPAAHGPWGPNSLHGRAVAGLLGHALDEAFGDPDFVPARFTVDLYRLASQQPIELTTRLVREGGRIRVAEVDLFQGGVGVARGSCQFLRVGAAPAGEVWSPPPWQVPAPDAVTAKAAANVTDSSWSIRQISGAFGEPGATVRRIWLSENHALVEGVPWTPFQRVAAACDVVSPLAHAAEAGLSYINSDVTLYLHRLPVGTWLGFEKGDHQATLGIAVGECRIYDLHGPIGLAACVALGQRRPPLMG